MPTATRGGASRRSRAAGAFGKADAGERGDGAVADADGDVERERGAASYEVCGDTTNNGACDTAWVSARQRDERDVAGRGAGVRHDVLLAGAGGVLPAATRSADGGTWWSFRTQIEAPGAFDKSAPANGAAGQSTSPTLTWGTSAAGGELRVLPRHDERRRVRRDVDEHGHEPERRAERAERRHDLLLARAGAERGRVHLRATGEHLVELHDAGRAPFSKS